MTNVQIDEGGNFTIEYYNYCEGCGRQKGYEEIKSHFDSGRSNKYTFFEFVPHVEKPKTLEELIAEIDAELSALDATPRMLSGALMGDQWAKDKIADIEIKQSALRDKRKALI